MTQEFMKAVVLHAYERPFEVKMIEKRSPADFEVLVKINYSGINPLDVKIRNGQAAHAKQTAPAVLGIDFAGTIEAVGRHVRQWQVGDQVYGAVGGVGGLQGTLAEFASVDAELLAQKPGNLSMREAAALPLVFITAWEGLVDRAQIKEGDNVLIHGGAGGVGHVAIQLARSFGANVYATGSTNSQRIITELGAVPIDYSSSVPEDYIQEFTNGAGFDIVYDTVGGATLDDCFRSVRRYTGRVVSALGWGMHSLAPLSFRGASYSGVFTLLPLLTGEGRRHHGNILKHATELALQGKLRPLLDEQHFTMENVQQAYDRIANRDVKGKLVVQVAR